MIRVRNLITLYEHGNSSHTTLPTFSQTRWFNPIIYGEAGHQIILPMHLRNREGEIGGFFEYLRSTVLEYTVMAPRWLVLSNVLLNTKVNKYVHTNVHTYVGMVEKKHGCPIQSITNYHLINQQKLTLCSHLYKFSYC